MVQGVGLLRGFAEVRSPLSPHAYGSLHAADGKAFGRARQPTPHRRGASQIWDTAGQERFRSVTRRCPSAPQSRPTPPLPELPPPCALGQLLPRGRRSAAGVRHRIAGDIQPFGAPSMRPDSHAGPRRQPARGGALLAPRGC